MPPQAVLSSSLLLAFALLPSAIYAISPGFPYGTEKVRGVNLGGWLVLEPWITPSLFENTGNPNIIDEWTFGQLQSKDVAQAALKAHWDSWITENDFQAIANAGLNHVRLPIGSWAFDVANNEPYISGQLPYLQKAVNWAGKYGLKLVVDLHGAPGSQNGFDNSGQTMSFPTWHQNADNIARTNAIIKTIASMFKDQQSVVPIIAPLNEPAGFDGQDILNTIRQYWLDSYGTLRYPYGTSQQGNTVLLIHDAFQPLSYWNDFMPSPNYDGVAIDTHIYQIFSVPENQMSESDHVQSACSHQSSLSSFYLWTIVGEWSPASTDCAKWLNGRNVGARYDGTYPGSSVIGSCTGKTGNAGSFSQGYKTFLRKFWEAQVVSYEKGAGWIQWTWKAENADEWSYQAGLQNGWIPYDPTDLQYPDVCG